MDDEHTQKVQRAVFLTLLDRNAPKKQTEQFQTPTYTPIKVVRVMKHLALIQGEKSDEDEICEYED
jgi:hypothetical protein